MNTDLQVGSKVKVIDKHSDYYRFRGTVVAEHLVAERTEGQPKPDVAFFICKLHSYLDNSIVVENVSLKPDQLDSIQKKFIDIEHIRRDDIDLGNGVVRKNNVAAFEVGDLIQISEKIDGANASVAWNEDEGKLEIFSRTNLLNGADGLRGFKPYIETKFDKYAFSKLKGLVIFGEWCVSHKVQYAKDWYNTWKVYDVYDKNAKNYWPQAAVKQLCEDHGLEYIHALYEGPFISWDHCRSFMHANSYGNSQEGIVVKNQSKLCRSDIHWPKYLKIVNDEFKESMVKKAKEKRTIDPEQLKEEQEANALMASVVTEARISKLLLKLVDEGKLPKDLRPKDMATACKLIPKMAWEDVLKEEKEIVDKVGVYAGKACSKLAIAICRKIIIGS